MIKSKAELNGLVGTKQTQKTQIALTNLQKLKKNRRKKQHQETCKKRSSFDRLAKVEEISS